MRCLHKNQEHTRRKFLYFVNRNNGEPVKIGHIFTKQSFIELIEIENVAGKSCSPNLAFIFKKILKKLLFDLINCLGKTENPEFFCLHVITTFESYMILLQDWCQ